MFNTILQYIVTLWVPCLLFFQRLVYTIHEIFGCWLNRLDVQFESGDQNVFFLGNLLIWFLNWHTEQACHLCLQVYFENRLICVFVLLLSLRWCLNCVGVFQSRVCCYIMFQSFDPMANFIILIIKLARMPARCRLLTLFKTSWILLAV